MTPTYFSTPHTLMLHTFGDGSCVSLYNLGSSAAMRSGPSSAARPPPCSTSSSGRNRQTANLSKQAGRQATQATRAARTAGNHQCNSGAAQHTQEPRRKACVDATGRRQHQRNGHCRNQNQSYITQRILVTSTRGRKACLLGRDGLSTWSLMCCRLHCNMPASSMYPAAHTCSLPVACAASLAMRATPTAAPRLAVSADEARASSMNLYTRSGWPSSVAKEHNSR